MHHRTLADTPFHVCLHLIFVGHALRTGVLVRGCLTAAVCRRTLHYRRRDGADGGKLSNLVSSDCGRLNAACGTISMVWSSPLQIFFAVVLLWRSLGPSVLGGIAVMVLMWPLQLAISRALARQRSLTAKATDERLQRTGAAIAASHAVKLERWELLCEQEVAEARRVERTALQREAMLKALNVLLATLGKSTTCATRARLVQELACRCHRRLLPACACNAPSPSVSFRSANAGLALHLCGTVALRRPAASVSRLCLACALQSSPRAIVGAS